ncbi:MAG: alpha/beta fold hydrolase [Chloroflexota bacterium]
MNIILIHGMGRTPLSMLPLQRRLKQRDHRVHLFGYSSTFQSLARTTERLVQLIHSWGGTEPYALIGHSLGSVIIRNAYPQLYGHEPVASFFLAPPMVVCKAARIFSTVWPLRILGGEMGSLLAREEFMQQLAMPKNTKIYAGTAGPRADWWPLGHEPNDGVLSAEEASGSFREQVIEVPSIHTFIMNSAIVFDDIVSSLEDANTNDANNLRFAPIPNHAGSVDGIGTRPPI